MVTKEMTGIVEAKLAWATGFGDAVADSAQQLSLDDRFTFTESGDPFADDGSTAAAAKYFEEGVKGFRTYLGGYYAAKFAISSVCPSPDQGKPATNYFDIFSMDLPNVPGAQQ